MRAIKRGPKLAFTLALALLASALAACGAKDAASRKPVYTPVNEAYALLDQGETGRAIALLEQILLSAPANAEARLMLSSAYMGQAGVDILSLHDSFHDVLFSHSLKEVFLSGDKPANPQDPLTGSSLPETRRARDDTPVERLFQDIDEFLNNLRRVLVIFDRFPHIGETKWPLLEQALWNLDQLPAARDVRVYRMFIRMVYFKEVLVTKVIRDPSFGTRAWGCQLELQALDESIFWMSDTLAKVSDDFIQVYPGQASPFVRVQAFLKVFTDELTSLQEQTPAGGDTGTLTAQRKLKEALRCADLKP